MAGGHGEVSDAQFKGWQKHFNTYTIRGRANVSYAMIFLFIECASELFFFFYKN